MARIIANNTKTEDAQFLTECCCPLCCLCYLLFNCLFVKERFEQEGTEETEFSVDRIKVRSIKVRSDPPRRTPAMAWTV